MFSSSKYVLAISFPRIITFNIGSKIILISLFQQREGNDLYVNTFRGIKYHRNHTPIHYSDRALISTALSPGITSSLMKYNQILKTNLSIS